MPFNFGVTEIVIVLVIGLLVFGPKKLPELGRGLGSGMRDFRRGLSGEADNDPPAQPVVVQSTTPVVETAVSVAASVSAEPVSEPVVATAAEPVAASAEASSADAKPTE